MKEVSQNEFEELIKRVLKKQISLRNIVEKLETTYSAINNRITSMRETNPELYAAYIEQRPYKPKRNSQIDSEALLANIMLENLTLRAASEEFEIPLRTIDRRIVEVKKQNPELYEMYKRYKKAELTLRDKQMLMEYGESVKSEEDASEIKLDEIKKILKEYERMVTDDGITRYQAAEKLGFTPQQIDEMHKKVRRITTQKNFKETIKVSPERMMRVVYKNETEQRTIVEPEKEK